MKDNRKEQHRINCLDALSVCRANCCSNGGGVALSPEEIESGFYEVEYLCIEKKEKCDRSEPCFHKIAQTRTTGRLCYYLGEDFRCSIYERRPKICREYHCAADGWKKDPENFLKREELRLSDGLVFEKSGARTLKEAIVPREGDKIYFIIRDVALCADIMAGGEFEAGALSEKDIAGVPEMFDGAKKLGEAQSEFEKRFGAEAVPAFRKLVLLLAGQKILTQRMR